LEERKRIQEADRRRELVLDCLLILAYDGEDVAQHQEYLKRRLDKDLERCDVCIRGYYRGKRELMQRLNKYAVL
jgi:senataxin